MGLRKAMGAVAVAVIATSGSLNYSFDASSMCGGGAGAVGTGVINWLVKRFDDGRMTWTGRNAGSVQDADGNIIGVWRDSATTNSARLISRNSITCLNGEGVFWDGEDSRFKSVCIVHVDRDGNVTLEDCH